MATPKSAYPGFELLFCVLLPFLALAPATTAEAATPSTNYYIYDESGHVIGEYDANGNPIQEHIYLGDRPVAVVQNGDASSIDYVTTDQLNTPRVITDSNQSVEWSLSTDPFGNGQPTGSLTYNLRFSGQYYDAETGYDYNYFRDYDPVNGRYIESDPVGLAGGNNTYVYGTDAPLDKDDPFGLLVQLCSRQLGGPNSPPLPGNSSNTLRHEYIVVNGQAFSFQPSGNELLSPGQVLNNETANSQCTTLCNDPDFDTAVLGAIAVIGHPTYCLLAVPGSYAYTHMGLHNCQTWSQDVLALAEQIYLQHEAKENRCPKCFKN